jgi:choline dehydrogenase-like flavoprotein
VRALELARGRAVGALAERSGPDGGRQRVRVRFRDVFVCAGAIQTPALLRRSGVRGAAGGTLRIQPMVKVAAEFDERLDAHESVMPVYQLRDPASGVFLGGSVFTPGFLGITLADRWPENAEALSRWRRMALYYAACRGTGRGSVRVFPGTGEAVARYALSREDARHLGAGLLRLCDVLFAGGARRVYAGLRDCPPLASPAEARRVLGASDGPPGPALAARMSLSTVHVTSSCPMGLDPRRDPVDPEGRLRGLAGVRVADASVLPEPPGVNPQGSVMALALRAAHRFLAG